MPLRLELPTIQNWSCHSCGGCCRQHAIEITAAEKARVEAQKWTTADGVPARIFESVGRSREGRFRLAHRDDGACVFLDDRGLCKIHAKFGEPAKPLACRVYPYAFHPAGDGVALSLRFSCPSVVANLGKPVAAQRRDLAAMQALVVPAGTETIPPPAVHGREELAWTDVRRVINALATFIERPESDLPRPLPRERAGERAEGRSNDESRNEDATPSPPPSPKVPGEGVCLPPGKDLFANKLLRLDFVTRMLGKATFDKIRGDRVDELMQVLLTASADEVPPIESFAPPAGLVRTQFRLVVAQYARKDTFAAESQSWAHRLRMLAAGWRLARGRGQTPAMQAALPGAAFEMIEGQTPSPGTLGEGRGEGVGRSLPSAASERIEALTPALPQRTGGGSPSTVDEIFSRYFAVKFRGLHFAGPAFYGRDLVDGLSALLLMFPITMYLARWHAAAAGRAEPNVEDVSLALTLADHHHGYSPAMNLRHFRKRVAWLAENEHLPALIAWMCVKEPRTK